MALKACRPAASCHTTGSQHTDRLQCQTPTLVQLLSKECKANSEHSSTTFLSAGCAASAFAAPGTHNDQADHDDFCCRVGSLVWGTVRRVQDFGAFIGFDDTRASGLVHISNISRQHVGYTDVSTASECCRFLCTAVWTSLTAPSLVGGGS